MVLIKDNYLLTEDIEKIILTLEWEHYILNGTGEDKPLGFLSTNDVLKRDREKELLSNLSNDFVIEDNVSKMAKKSYVHYIEWKTKEIKVFSENEDI